MMPVDLVLDRLVLVLRAALGRAPCSSPPRSRPPWLECASSMMMAKFRPRCSSPISSRMNGNFCTVEMMIFLPPSMNFAQLAGAARRAPTVAPTWANCLIVSRICLSRMRRSVTTMIESKTSLVVLASGRSAGARARRSSWSCRCQPSAGSGSACPPRARARRPAACGRRRAGGSAGRSASGFFLPVFSSFSSTIWA